MPFRPGERVDWLPIISQHPDTAVFQLTDEDGNTVMQPLTLANGGLELRRKNALHPVFNVPHKPGKYAYRYWDQDQVTSGHIRVTTDTPTGPPPEPAPTRPPTRWT